MSRKTKSLKKKRTGIAKVRRKSSTTRPPAPNGNHARWHFVPPHGSAPSVHFSADTPDMWGNPPFRAECDIQDCEVEGTIPSNIDGAFYRVGPDWQYPPAPGNIIFDGEGHVSVFRIKNGRADFRSRYVRTQRFKAQAEARRRLFGVYRNPFTDDPSVARVSRGTANTHVVYHHGRLFALKEDSPPVAMNPLTLETLDDYYTFHGGLHSLSFTAHPKFDPLTGEMLGFGFEAKGLATDDVAVYAVDSKGKVTWEAWIKVPYVGILHDFVVTQTHIGFLVFPMATNVEGMKHGQIHFAWDSTLPTWYGVMRRGGDGKDLRWFKGPARCAMHVMGAFSDGDRLYADMEMSLKNTFPFFPNLHGEPFDPVAGAAHLTRVSVDLSKKAGTYDMEILYPQVGILPRQDERYQTLPYHVGFMPTTDPAKPRHPNLAHLPFHLNNCYTRCDHATRKTSSFFIGDDATLQEASFIPRGKNAPEGDGYVIGVANRLLEGGRADLVIVDTQHMEDGPVATVKLPFRSFSQVHGCWVQGDVLPEN
ncbi:MAG: carotenoid oxygenase family protein [Candidatus Acidiferrales bacterium]